ncbi:hypothetical protein ACHAW5_010299 [Stephanodiscus triporus]|uniref:Hemolysin III n=1 Tax=Stephanodiscus triporus TaxID=2934178 RepID=A0ABD3N4U2_9STRA
MAMSDEEAVSSSLCYQQLNDPPGQLLPHHDSRSFEVDDSDNRHPPGPVVLLPEPPSWSLADTGGGRRKLVDDYNDDDFRRPPQLLSRDGPHHVTGEVFNSASHLFAGIMSLLSTVLLIMQSGRDVWKIISFGVYGLSLMFLFACSMLHHTISATEEVEARLRMLDYLAIYPLITGIFTPVCLVCLRDSVIGWSFLGVAWFLAFAGMTMTAMFGVERILMS